MGLSSPSLGVCRLMVLLALYTSRLANKNIAPAAFLFEARVKSLPKRGPVLHALQSSLGRKISIILFINSVGRSVSLLDSGRGSVRKGEI